MDGMCWGSATWEANSWAAGAWITWGSGGDTIGGMERPELTIGIGM
jgi:hypothetical protein